jgi:hypothetical protein
LVIVPFRVPFAAAAMQSPESGQLMLPSPLVDACGDPTVELVHSGAHCGVGATGVGMARAVTVPPDGGVAAPVNEATAAVPPDARMASVTPTFRRMWAGVRRLVTEALLLSVSR